MLFAEIFLKLYKVENHRVRNSILRIVRRMEGGEMYSRTLRDIFRRYHNVDIGMYTHGGCFVPGQMHPHTTIGRYSSIAHGVRVFNRDHPLNFKSTHAFFFNSRLGWCDDGLVEYNPISIGNDVWIGYGSTVLANVCRIGDGAVIGAGANVNKDIPPYAVVVGNPGRIVRYRFPKNIIEELLASRWWEMPIEEIRPMIKEFQRPYFNEKLPARGGLEKNADLD